MSKSEERRLQEVVGKLVADSVEAAIEGACEAFERNPAQMFSGAEVAELLRATSKAVGERAREMATT